MSFIILILQAIVLWSIILIILILIDVFFEALEDVRRMRNTINSHICLDNKHHWVVDGTPDGQFYCMRCNILLVNPILQ